MKSFGDRRYPVSRRPAVVDLGRPAAAAVRPFAAAVRDALGVSLWPSARGSCLVLPPLHELRKDGRALRGDEYDGAAAAIAELAAATSPESIRWVCEAMVTFDWDAFDRDARRSLDATFARLPGWLGAGRWFGRDKELGPCLWTSVEAPGLQVWGILEPEIFDDWERRLLQETRELPFRSIG